MSTTKNIVLIDDHFIVRHGLKKLIEKIGPYRISHQFEDGKEFVAALPGSIKTDLIILDLSMPIMTGEEVMEKLNAAGIKTPVLVLTVGTDEEIIIKLFKLGIRGYLMKNCSADELKEALNEIFRTGYYHNDFLVHSFETNPNASNKNKQKNILELISDREREFLKFVFHEKDYSYEQIADLMHTQLRTIHWYRESIFKKLGVKSKTGLVLYIVRNKLFDYL